jgi:hypothetical protein
MHPSRCLPTFLFSLFLAITLFSSGAHAQSHAPVSDAVDIATTPAVLVMIGDPGCPYCARFEREVAPGYRASDDGKLVPLVRRDRHDADVAFIPKVVYSPTFIMLVRGREIGRIVGYGGTDIFWMQVAALLADARAALGRTGLVLPAAPRYRY